MNSFTNVVNGFYNKHLLGDITTLYLYLPPTSSRPTAAKASATETTKASATGAPPPPQPPPRLLLHRNHQMGNIDSRYPRRLRKSSTATADLRNYNYNNDNYNNNDKERNPASSRRHPSGGLYSPAAACMIMRPPLYHGKNHFSFGNICFQRSACR